MIKRANKSIQSEALSFFEGETGFKLISFVLSDLFEKEKCVNFEIIEAFINFLGGFKSLDLVYKGLISFIQISEI